MREKVWKTIEKYGMFPRGSRLIVGVSGGADSVALLHLLNSWKEAEGWEIVAVHIHHGLRGAEADLDQQFVEKLCEKLHIPCVTRRFDVAAEAKKRRLGEEETGRLLRYAVFQEIAGKEGQIAVAHHQNDQAETLLMRLCRGTGLTGLVGMTPVREKICRPLLFCSRKEIEAYCRAEGLHWQEDATNAEEKYTRNKLRLRVIPVLEEINPKAVEHIAETAQLLSQEEDYLQLQAEMAYQSVKMPAPTGEVHLQRKALKTLHPAMKSRVLRKAMAEFLQTDVSQVQIEELEALLEKSTGKSRDFLQGITAENRYDRLVLSRKKEKVAVDFKHTLPLGQEVEIPEVGITVTMWAEKSVETSADTCTNVFDYDKITEKIVCRTRQTGDFIRLKNGRKKIKDLFIDAKIPREERETYPLITMGEEVLWVPGLRVSKTFRAEEQTKRFLSIRIRRSQV